MLPLKCLENISLASRQASDKEEVNGATSPTRVAEPVGGEVPCENGATSPTRVAEPVGGEVA